jgi:tight adherence protein B
LGIVVFAGVSMLVGGAAVLLRSPSSDKLEDRLAILTGTQAPAAKEELFKQKSLLAQPLDGGSGMVKRFLERFGNIDLFFEQADVSLSAARLAMISAGLAVLSSVVGIALRLAPLLFLVASLCMGAMPTMWVVLRRRRRLKAFGAQLPAALEMLARALRAGQSLAAGFGLVQTEIGPPLGKEFGRIFEEQNLGLPLEESLSAMANRTPNLDLKFFATAVILQRQTGGDLAEILDKIGDLVRQRFQIWGQIQALTGEGRLSGVVLLGLPVLLFFAIYHLNPGYVSVLFSDPLGKKMLAAAIVFQVIGALVIRKIVNIQV